VVAVAGPGPGCFCVLPGLPGAVVGASRATRGRLASIQGCQRCPCPSPWVATGAARVVACRCFSCQVRQHTETAPAPATKATVLRKPSPKKENTGEACGNPLLLLPCGCRCRPCSRRPACCGVAAACRCCRCRAAAACCCLAVRLPVLPRYAAPRSPARRCVAALRTQPLLPVVKLRISR
jgi:hypothetical protein